MEVTEQEKKALVELADSADPMAKVLYHMSTRQLDMCEMIKDLSTTLKKVVEYVDKNTVKPNGSIPPLSLVLGDQHGSAP